MFGIILKNQSILKKFLLINLIIFIFIGGGTVIYLKTVQPNLIKKKCYAIFAMWYKKKALSTERIEDSVYEN